ncbi:hypothetical protein K7472_09140 [Streptomyces sp. PTM05]|uniref:Uncharacterized protein n=1 Tax=Streptantibioticus parmotrematis TaxID=2873249 RepID=A0ABS7QP99_9ACTN|nr:hypothetical protein [Streptantibioticus parmotrematis]MBY8885008.1 hypothetical protein [Streptantibioticus parmotrematis]
MDSAWADPGGSGGGVPPDRRPQAPYECEAVAYTPDDRQCFPLGALPAATPRLALRWLMRRARDITDQLDPRAARPGRHWINDTAEHERALALLASGEPYVFTVFDDPMRYALTARPTGAAR